MHNPTNCPCLHMSAPGHHGYRRRGSLWHARQLAHFGPGSYILDGSCLGTFVRSLPFLFSIVGVSTKLRLKGQNATYPMLNKHPLSVYGIITSTLALNAQFALRYFPYPICARQESDLSIVGEDVEAWDAKKIAVERPTRVVTMSNDPHHFAPQRWRTAGDGYT